MNGRRPTCGAAVFIGGLSLLLMLGWSALAQVHRGESKFGPDIASDPRVWDMLARLSRDRALSDLRQLAGETPICVEAGCATIANRKTGNSGLVWALDYLDENLRNAGYSVQRWNWASSGFSGQDLIVRRTGVLSPSEEIYIVAHVDGVQGTGERYPAADDNASGVVGLLELARILRGYSFQRTVVLLFTTGEEQGTLGVESYLAQLSPAQMALISSAIDVDMIGYDGNGDRAMELWHGDHPPSLQLTRMMSDTIRAYQLNLNPRLVVGCG